MFPLVLFLSHQTTKSRYSAPGTNMLSPSQYLNDYCSCRSLGGRLPGQVPRDSSERLTRAMGENQMSYGLKSRSQLPSWYSPAAGAIKSQQVHDKNFQNLQGNVVDRAGGLVSKSGVAAGVSQTISERPLIICYSQSRYRSTYISMAQVGTTFASGSNFGACEEASDGGWQLNLG